MRALTIDELDWVSGAATDVGVPPGDDPTETITIYGTSPSPGAPGSTAFSGGSSSGAYAGAVSIDIGIGEILGIIVDQYNKTVEEQKAVDKKGQAIRSGLLNPRPYDLNGETMLRGNDIFGNVYYLYDRGSDGSWEAIMRVSNGMKEFYNNGGWYPVRGN